MAEKGDALSERELEVLQCVSDGAGNKEIAAKLSISQNTVKVHLRNVYTKLGVSSRTEATMVALQQGLVILEGIVAENSTLTSEPTSAAAATDPKPAPLPQPISTANGSSNATTAPRFFPRRIGLISLLLLLLAASIFFAYQAFGNDVAPTTATEPFEETAVTNDWLQSRPLPAGRANMALVANGLNLYLIGGQTATGVTNTVSIYRTTEFVWQEGSPKPTAVTDITGAELFGEIYVPGGLLADGQPTDAVEVYSPANDSWRSATPLPTAVSGGLVLSDGSFLYLFGGWDGQDYLADAYRFDPAANSWQILPGMATARAFATGAVVKGKLYVVGGYDGERPLSECAYFDPAVNNSEVIETEGGWATCANTLLPRAGAGAASLFNKLYVFGGGAFGDASSSEISITYSESYDPDADQWSIVNTPPLSEEPGWPSLGITSVETRIYAVGGLRGAEITAETFVYKPLVYQTFLPIAPVESSNP